MLISILIPAYNEEKTLETVVTYVSRYLAGMNFEIILVDDGSKDLTPVIGKQLEKTFPHVHYFRHAKNSGKTQAIDTAIQHSKGDILIIQDADMEYHPKYLKRVLLPIMHGYVDVCFGSRFRGSIRGMRPHHVFGNIFLTFATYVLFRFHTTDMETGYKAFKREIITKIIFKGKGFELEPYIAIQIARMKCRFGEVPINFNARQYGEKKISWRDGLQAFLVLCRNATANGKLV